MIAAAFSRKEHRNDDHQRKPDQKIEKQSDENHGGPPVKTPALLIGAGVIF